MGLHTLHRSPRAAGPHVENRSRALVTGASAGIGEAFARRLAREGHQVVLVARRGERLEVLAEELRSAFGAQAEVVVADLSDAAGQRDIEAVIREAPLDLLVNNAGLLTVGRFAELDADREEAEIRLNVVAAVRLTRAALRRCSLADAAPSSTSRRSRASSPGRSRRRTTRRRRT